MPICCVPGTLRFQSTLPLRGATRLTETVDDEVKPFQSTLPLRGATSSFLITPRSCRFQSTLPLRGATRTRYEGRPSVRYFNPHSPCGERPSPFHTPISTWDFNPHSPCGERPSETNKLTAQNLIFQSTLPLRGATKSRARRCACRPYFNPHSPCGERRNVTDSADPSPVQFQSTLPLRGATGIVTVDTHGETISIHTPLAGSDMMPILADLW